MPPLSRLGFVASVPLLDPGNQILTHTHSPRKSSSRAHHLKPALKPAVILSVFRGAGRCPSTLLHAFVTSSIRARTLVLLASYFHNVPHKASQSDAPSLPNPPNSQLL